MADLDRSSCIENLLGGSSLSDKCESMQGLIELRCFDSQAIAAVSKYKDSVAPLFFGVTLGDIASVYLDLSGKESYSGSNDVVVSLISLYK